jgi:hypothetical protein
LDDDSDDAENGEDNHTMEANSDRYNHAGKKTDLKNKGKKAAGNVVEVDVSFLFSNHPQATAYTQVPTRNLDDDSDDAENGEDNHTMEADSDQKENGPEK